MDLKIARTQMVRTKLKMNSDLKEAFSQIKPVCDVLMVCPSLESLSAFSARVAELKKEVVQELQQYLLYPLISRIKCTEIKRRVEMHIKILDAVRIVLEKITVNSFEMYMKLETGLLSIIFDANKPGMISDATEEVKYNTLRCLTVLMLNIPHEFRLKLLKNQVPMLAQAVFVSVHIAKLERLRVLRVAAIQCVTAHTMTHPQLTVEYRMPDEQLELLAIDNMLSSILPGVLAALQDVCACTDNPTHLVIAGAIEAIHRILCIPMHNKYLPKKTLTAGDFVNYLRDQNSKVNREVSSEAPKSPKDMEKRSEEWFTMAGEKLTLITKSLVALRTFYHFKVRKELAIYCYRILTECSLTMPASIPFCLDVLISLSKDEYPEVSQYCTTAVKSYFMSGDEETRLRTMDSLSDNFLALLTSLPRVLNNIDSSRKLSALNLVHGYITTMWSHDGGRTVSQLAAPARMQALLCALAAAALHDTGAVSREICAARDVLSPPPTKSPWSILRHLESEECVRRLQEICVALGASHCAHLILDNLIQGFVRERSCEYVYIMNWMATSPDSSEDLVKRIINTYIEEDVWYLPLEVSSQETPLTSNDTLDVSVYNPREWHKETVPDLYEGTVETRYTPIPLTQAQTNKHSNKSKECTTSSQARYNLTLCCLLTEGLGHVATRLREEYQPYMMRTLCMLLERVGSEYRVLHEAGLRALGAVSLACGHSSAADLISWNADYFTHEITVRLKRAWNCQSALQILSVVMEYSDSTILDCLYGIVDDILVQSCDKYYENDLLAYLQAFHTFIQCIRKWFPIEEQKTTEQQTTIDLLADVNEYVKETQEAERLLSDSDFEKSCGKSVEEMYKEDMKKKEEDELDYDDKVTEEKEPEPTHVTVTTTVVTRTINFINSPHRDTALLALQVVTCALPHLSSSSELFPLVHRAWSPLTARVCSPDPVVKRQALQLLLVVADTAKDFLRSQGVDEVLNEMYKCLSQSSQCSYLKDAGSAYRNSPAYKLQQATLDALPSLLVNIGLHDAKLEDAMCCVDTYLSNRQPKPLQASAVHFFKTLLEYDYPATWFHLRKFCANDIVLEPPTLEHTKLDPIVGTPFQPKDKEYENNIKLIFDFMVS